MFENSFTLPSFAKINLLLHISGKRADGFHEICTIFQTVSLCDYLTFSRADEINLTCDDQKIPINADNLIVRAAKLLQEKFNVFEGANIHLQKNIPAPGGLGGGSSNAAVALIGLMKLWGIKVEFKDLCELGEKLGSDVPFFLYGGTAFGIGRGTEISSLDDFEQTLMLIVTPKINVSTGDAFRQLNATDLTNKGSKSILQICRDTVNSSYLRQSELKNDFERVIFEIEPETAQVKEKLFALGAKRALLSGSGASVFGIFDSNEKRQNAFDLMRLQHDWRVFPVETVSRLVYRNSLRIDKIFA